MLGQPGHVAQRLSYVFSVAVLFGNADGAGTREPFSATKVMTAGIFLLVMAMVQQMVSIKIPSPQKLGEYFV